MSAGGSDTSWLDVVRAFASGNAVAPWVLEDLLAFHTAQPRGGPPPGPEWGFQGSFEDMEAHFAAPVDVSRLAQVMSDEAEGRQPEIFARRVAAVENLLAGLHAPAGRVLRIGLRVRLADMCAAPSPRLHRVRALADFYYSLGVRLHHPEWVENERHLEDLVNALTWSEVRPGIEHALIDGLADGMPVHVNLLRIDSQQVEIDVADLGHLTRDGTPIEHVLEGRSDAAISGGFFLYSEQDISAPSRRHDPVGLLLAEGEVISPPIFRRAGVLVGPAGEIALRPISMDDVEVGIAGETCSLQRVWNRAEALTGPDEPSFAIIGRKVVALGRSLPVPLNGFVATCAGPMPSGIAVGADVRYGPPCVEGVPARSGICGGPMLVSGGAPVLDMRAEDFWGSAPPITFSQDETGDRNLLARMAVGLDADGRLLAAAIDGRNMRRALGMTLADTARLMIRLGCVEAANMDGGSSKRMVVQGEVKDLPSTEIVAGESAVTRVRPVHSAILFRGRD